MIRIVDYEMGNIHSVINGFQYVGLPAELTADPEEISKSSVVILPGVGAFGSAMEKLGCCGLADAIRERAFSGGLVIGICLGMQLFFQESEESPGVQGLGLFTGKVLRFTGRIKVPHMGWNRVMLERRHILLAGIKENSFFYFANSYYASPEEENIIIARSFYGREFPAVVCRHNICGIQFHPEKSSSQGLKILANLKEMIRRWS